MVVPMSPQIPTPWRPLGAVATGLVTLALLGAGPGCGRPRPRPDRGANRVDPRQHASSAVARRAALHLSDSEVRKRLGGYRFQAQHRIASTVDGKPDRAWSEDYLLLCRKNGDCHGRLQNSREYGVEFVRLGEQTYFRHRYQPYLRFHEEPDQAEHRIQRIWGIGAAVVDLVGRFVDLAPIGKGQVAGRAVVRYQLKRRARPRKAAEQGRRAWRASMTVKKVSGEVALDAATGVPLSLKIDYAVTAPRKGHTVGISGSLQGQITAVGSPGAVTAPTQFTQAKSRRREVLDERHLLHDWRLNPGWFRGGGPYAARRRGRERAHPHTAPRRVAPGPRPPAARPAARRPAARPAVRPPARPAAPRPMARAMTP